MSNLTQEENAMVLDAVRFKASHYITLYGVSDPALEALVAKLTPVDEPVVEEAPAKTKSKAK